MPFILQLFRSKARNCAVAAVLLVGLTSCGRDPKTYIERGNRFFDAGKYDDAALQYKRVLQKNANSGEAWYRLALVDLKRGNSVDAYLELRRAVDLMPDDI